MASGVTQPFVRTDEGLPGRSVVAPHERRGELMSVGGALRMGGEQAARPLADAAGWRDDIAVFHETDQSLERLIQGRRAQRSLAMASIQR